MSNLPIKGDLTEFVSNNLARKGVYEKGSSFIKVYSELFNSMPLKEMEFGRFNDYMGGAGDKKEAAKRLVRIYMRLREYGFFHPQTQFFLATDKHGDPSLVSVMPKMAITRLFAHEVEKFQSDLEEKMRTTAHHDVGYPFNYGTDGENDYLIDLHIFPARK